MKEDIIMTRPSINNTVNKEKYLLDYLNKNHLPESVKGLVHRLQGVSSVFDDLYQIRRDLEKIPDPKSVKDEEQRDKEMYYKNLFLGLVYLFLIPEKNIYKSKALTCLKYAYKNTKSVVTDRISQEIIHSTIVSLIYKLERVPKILIIVDEDYSFGTDTKFMSFNRHYLKKFVKVEWIAKSETPDMIKMLSEYDQLFVFAHGEDEGGTSVGNIGITDEWMKVQWLKSKKKVKVLGIFSCQEKSWASDIISLFDYYFTDTKSSGTNENELFIFVFISTYIRSWNIVDSFRLGRFGPIFRTSSDIGYELYEGGMRID